MINELNEIQIETSPKSEVYHKITELLNIESSSLLISFNLDCLRISSINDQFKNICQTAELVLADGVGITSLLRLKNGRKIERVTGSDVFRELLNLSNSKELRYAFIGSTPEVSKILRSKLAIEFPKLTDYLIESPPYGFENDESINSELVNKLVNFRPSILFIALGCPRQEIWLSRNKDIIGAKVNVGVGAVFDFYTGYKCRAPIFIQNIGFEWIWRMLSEPKRLLNRYILHDCPFYIKCLFKLIVNKSF